ncbi:iron siderophore ABC transporter substrate-binding protein [Nocardioides sp. Root190]|uniref:ABC transporter substrate-binding protein n=1 Tax=Nocardioides sp. Root190 TaxID=1736488 RepID=UPI0006F9E62E|nr:iron-siderophore ABC transporter substrate-binding protein [Nocardioides sp. Root190]KRB76888.1 iron siderophore ABC transporter substrate-binding protein [Nocardioides sp. Root190]
MSSKQLSRGAAALAVAALLGTLLSACGSDRAAIDGPTRSITDVRGETVEIPVTPERVVTLSEPTLDGALALGVTPVGTVSGRGQAGAPGYLVDLAGDIPLLGGVAQPNFEEIGDARPDLILVDETSINNNPPAIEALERIAPLVVTGHAGGDWRENLALTADALNLAEKGREVIAEYDAEVTRVKAALTDVANDTFSVVRWQGGAPSLILKELPAGVALEDLGLARPPSQDKRGRGHSSPISLENLADIDADRMFFGTLGGSSVSNPSAGGGTGLDAARQALAEAVKVPGFTSLTAYQDDAIIPVDGSLWTSTGGPLLMRRLVENIERELAR